MSDGRKLVRAVTQEGTVAGIFDVTFQNCGMDYLPTAIKEYLEAEDMGQRGLASLRWGIERVDVHDTILIDK